MNHQRSRILLRWSSNAYKIRTGQPWVKPGHDIGFSTSQHALKLRKSVPQSFAGSESIAFVYGCYALLQAEAVLPERFAREPLRHTASAIVKQDVFGKIVMRFARAIILALLSASATAIAKWPSLYQIDRSANRSPNVGPIQRSGVIVINAPAGNSSAETDQGRESSRIKVRDAPSGSGRRPF